MASRSTPSGPDAPRVPAPDLAPVLDEVTTLARHDDAAGAHVSLRSTTDAAHARLAESLMTVDADVLDLEGATLSDVHVRAPRLAELRSPRSRWRGVLVEGGRIGTLELAAAELDGVELRGIRIDYLSLAHASVRDLLVVDCVLHAIDLPLATLKRVRFEGCRVDEVDTRELRSTDLDLRGLDALSYTDAAALRGATMTEQQALGLSQEFAAALGIRLA